MRTLFRTFLGLAPVALIAGPAAAQGRGFGRSGSLAFLLGNESVQKEIKLDDKQVDKVKDLVEKPPHDQAPSDLGLIGRYVLTPSVFDHIARLRPGAGGELQLTDAHRVATPSLRATETHVTEQRAEEQHDEIEKRPHTPVDSTPLCLPGYAVSQSYGPGAT